MQDEAFAKAQERYEPQWGGQYKIGDLPGYDQGERRQIALDLAKNPSGVLLVDH